MTEQNDVLDPTTLQKEAETLRSQLATLQRQLAEARSGFQDERAKWDGERKSFETQLAEVRQTLTSTEGQVTEWSTKWNDVTAQLDAKAKEQETLAAKLARQGVLLKHPQLVSDPVLKLVEASTLAPEDLEATLAAMSQTQQQVIMQTYKDAQSGATGPVQPAAGQDGGKKAQADDLFKQATDALAKGDLATYGSKYGEYLTLADQIGASGLAKPRVLEQRPMFERSGV